MQRSGVRVPLGPPAIKAFVATIYGGLFLRRAVRHDLLDFSHGTPSLGPCSDVTHRARSNSGLLSVKIPPAIGRIVELP